MQLLRNVQRKNFSPIDAVAAIRDEWGTVSWKLELGGKFTLDMGAAILRADRDQSSHTPFVAVFNK